MIQSIITMWREFRMKIMNINFSQFLIIFAAVLVLSIGLGPATSYSATIDSPKKQVINGANPESVVCKSDFTLMIRSSGGPACVKSQTATKLQIAKWGEIKTKSTAELTPIKALINYRTIDEKREKDGLAIIDLNPHSKSFGNILQDVPVGKNVLLHHPFYNSDKTKIYNTALMGDRLYNVNIHDNKIFDVSPIETGSCIVGEDMIFSQDGEKFYLTCMGSNNILVFDAKTDELIDEIFSSQENSEAYTKYPHGISANEKINRMIVTQTVSPNLDDPQSSVTVIELNTGKVLSNIKLEKTEGTPSAPVEVLFHPNFSLAYVSGMLDGTIWVLVWDEDTQSFVPKLADDGAQRDHSWPLDLNIGPNGNLFVSFAIPGVVNEYDLENAEEPKLVRTMPAMPGAHHTLFSSDGKYMFVQNNLLNLDGLNSGTISVVDLTSGNLIATIDDMLKQGMMIESIDFIYEDSLTKTTSES